MFTKLAGLAICRAYRKEAARAFLSTRTTTRYIHCAFPITMPSWWDYLHFNRQYQNKRNLEEGLFQIASQTCNILVKVNNTNNINLTRNNRSDEYGCAGPPKGKSSTQICIPKFRKESITSGCNPGLSVSN